MQHAKAGFCEGPALIRISVVVLGWRTVAWLHGVSVCVMDACMRVAKRTEQRYDSAGGQVRQAVSYACHSPACFRKAVLPKCFQPARWLPLMFSDGDF